MSRSDSLFWLRWTIACTLAGALTGGLEAAGLQFAATLGLSGLLVGVGQAMLLWYRQNDRLTWLLFSGLGWVGGTLLALGLDFVLNPFIQALTRLGGWEVLWLNMVQQPLILLVFGAAQAMLLARSHTVPWLMVSTVSGLLKGMTSAAVCFLYCDALGTLAGAIVTTAVVYASGWAAYGMVTGLVMQRLLQRLS